MTRRKRRTKSGLWAAVEEVGHPDFKRTLFSIENGDGDVKSVPMILCNGTVWKMVLVMSF